MHLLAIFQSVTGKLHALMSSWIMPTALGQQVSAFFRVLQGFAGLGRLGRHIILQTIRQSSQTAFSATGKSHRCVEYIAIEGIGVQPEYSSRQTLVAEAVDCRYVDVSVLNNTLQQGKR